MERTAMGDRDRAGRIHVLVVDDEPAIRDTVRRALERRSWTVLEASSLDEAMAVLREGEQDGARIDLLVADVVLEDGMSGLTLAESALRFQPSLPVLFISGYVDLEVKLESSPDAVTDFIGKPMSVTRLLQTADELLARSRSVRSKSASG